MQVDKALLNWKIMVKLPPLNFSIDLIAGGILRPCDQYPSEPGVLKSRPLSSLSAHSNYGGGGTLGSRGGAAGHKTECSSTSGHSPRDRDCDDFVEPSSSVGVSC